MTTTVYQGQTNTLLVDFYQYAGGPAADVTGLTITVKTADGLTTILGPTSTGVNHVATGVYSYDWAVSSSQAAGSYVAIWSGTDAQSQVVQATESLLVQASTSSFISSAQNPWYCTREEVKQALDVKQTARNDSQVDRACASATQAIEGLCHRVFYPTFATKHVDWPNFQYAYPWRVWLDRAELADVTATVPIVLTGSDTIPSANIFWGNPRRNSPPYTYLELNRSTSSSFGHSSTPQRDITITGVFGYNIDTKPGGPLAAAVTDTTSTTITVSDGSLVGVGDQLLVDSERLVVTGRSNVTSSQTQQSTGAGTADDSDVTLAVTTGSAFHVGEVVQLDSERMLVVDVTGNNLTVIRAWDGTVLATHSGATVYVSRNLTVVRGSQGTTAAAHSNAAPVSVHAAPSLIKQLAVAEAVMRLTQEAGAYASAQGSGQGSQTNIGAGIADLRCQVQRRYGRVARQRVI